MIAQAPASRHFERPLRLSARGREARRRVRHYMLFSMRRRKPPGARRSRFPGSAILYDAAPGIYRCHDAPILQMKEREEVEMGVVINADKYQAFSAIIKLMLRLDALFSQKRKMA